MKTELKHDVFISFSFKDQEKTEAIINRLLNKHHITYWICTRDVRAGELYDDKIYEAIEAARAFVLVQSRSSVESEEVPKEIRLAMSFKKTIIPFVIEDCEWRGGIAYQLTNVQQIKAIRPTFEDRVDELAEEIRKIIGKEKSGGDVYSDWNYQTSSFLTSSTVFPDINFVGREAELDLLHQKLSAIPNKVFLQGIGGIGKSEIAKMYTKIHAKEYDTIIWITFEKSLLHTFINDNSLTIKNMSRAEYASDNDETYFRKKLCRLKEITDEKVLLIIDNFDVQYDPHLEEICSGKYAIIFTTRNHRISNNIPEIIIDKMENDDDLFELFKIEYKRRTTTEDESIIKEIITYYDKHTLSIRLVAGAMSTQRIKPQSMIDMIRKKHEITDRERKTADLIFDKIKDVFALSNLTNNEVNILMNLSLVPLCGIEVEYLYELCEYDDFDVIEGLIDKSWVIHNLETDEVYLHPIIAELASDLLKKQPDLCKKFISNLHARCQYSAVNVSYNERRRNLIISESVYNRIFPEHALFDIVKYTYGYCILDNTQYYRAADIFRDLMNRADDLCYKINCCEKTAQCYVLCGESEMARDVALTLYHELSDMKISDMSPLFGRYYTSLLHRLIEAYRGLEEYDLSVYYAKLCMEQCRDFYEIYPGDSFGWTKYHLGRTYAMKGDNHHSELMLLQAIDIFEKNNDLNAQGCAYSVLALAYSQEGDYSKAIQTYKKANDFIEPLLGKEHVDIANNERWCGEAYAKIGNVHEAKKCYMKAIDIYHKKGCKIPQYETELLLNKILSEK